MKKVAKGKKDDDITERLIKSIRNLPDDRKEELLELLPRLDKAARRRKGLRKALMPSGDEIETHSSYVVQNISSGGVFIRTSVALELGQDLSLVFTFPGLDDPVRVTGEVVRKTRDGVGLRFKKADLEDKVFESLIESL